MITQEGAHTIPCGRLLLRFNSDRMQIRRGGRARDRESEAISTEMPVAPHEDTLVSLQ